jgi:phosphoribosylcarboxyaminoimidazole (NCAIR) mutase
MGSSSDLPTMHAAVRRYIVSAHRTTGQMNVASAVGADVDIVRDRFVVRIVQMLKGVPVATNGSDWSCNECWFVGGPYFVHQST